jgi:hypothetical protein
MRLQIAASLLLPDHPDLHWSGRWSRHSAQVGGAGCSEEGGADTRSLCASLDRCSQAGCWVQLLSVAFLSCTMCAFRDAQHCNQQHSTAQHSTAQHSTAQHSTAQHSTAQHSTAQHSTAQHSTAQHTARHSTGTQVLIYWHGGATRKQVHATCLIICWPCCRQRILHTRPSTPGSAEAAVCTSSFFSPSRLQCGCWPFDRLKHQHRRLLLEYPAGGCSISNTKPRVTGHAHATSKHGPQELLRARPVLPSLPHQPMQGPVTRNTAARSHHKRQGATGLHQ